MVPHRQGPYILEMLTYRYRGHLRRQPAKYRTREEVDEIRTHHDPIDMARQRILEKKFANEETPKKIDAEIRDQVNQAAEFATHDPSQTLRTLYRCLSLFVLSSKP